MQTSESLKDRKLLIGQLMGLLTLLDTVSYTAGNETVTLLELTILEKIGYHQEHGIAMSGLARVLHLTNAMVAAALAHLLPQGLIEEKSQLEGGKRSRVFHLTRQGAETLLAIRQRCSRNIAERFVDGDLHHKGMTNEEVGKLLPAVKKVFERASDALGQEPRLLVEQAA